MKTNEINLFRSRGLLVLFTLMLAFVQHKAVAQDGKITVEGLVTSSDDGLPLPGVNVILQGTSKGTITDFDGNYSIKVKKGDKLRFEFIGKKPKIIVVDGEKLDLVLESSAEELEDVVIIGFGVAKKKEITGAVKRVKASDIESNLSADLGTRLQGQITGVNVTGNGEIGAPAEIFIRGVPSVFGSVTPLYVVDGIPQDGDPQLSPSEIETIDVLKDAASTAVYGSRGANGVVLISTKQGKEGNTKFTFNASAGIRRVTSDIDLLNAQETFVVDNLSVRPQESDEFRRISNSAYFNDSNAAEDVISDNALTNAYDFSMSGGKGGFTYNAIVGYFTGKGVFINSESFDRINTRLNAAYRKDRLNLRLGLAYQIEDAQRSSGGSFSRGLTRSALLAPVKPGSSVIEVEYDNLEDNERQASNEANQSLNTSRVEDRKRYGANINLSYNLIDDYLTFTTRAGYTVTEKDVNFKREPTRYFNLTTGTFLDEGNISSALVQNAFNKLEEYTWDGSFTSKIKVGRSAFNFLAALSVESREFSALSKRATEFNNADDISFRNATNTQSIEGFITSIANILVPNFAYERTERIIGAIGRFQYNYDDKYLFSALIRRDESSKFSKENRVGYFPSASAGWNISNESFWYPLSNVVNTFRVRASFGTTGNDRIPVGAATNFVVPSSEFITEREDENGNSTSTEVSQGNTLQALGDKKLKWETTEQFNYGVDLSFFKNRLNFSADYYITEKKDLLFRRTLPPSSGANSTSRFIRNTTFQNLADLDNEGIELSLQYKDAYKDSKWSIQVNYSANENKIKNLPINDTGDVPIIQLGSQSISGQGINRGGFINSNVLFLAEGLPAGALFLFRTDGVINTDEELTDYINRFSNGNAIQTGDFIPQKGDLKFVDVNGDGKLDLNDKEFRGTTLPDFDLSVNLNYSYKNWALSMLWYGAFGQKIYNGSEATNFLHGTSKQLLNQYDEFYNPTSEIPKKGSFANRRNSPNLFGNTDRYLEDGDFVRLKNIRLTYSFPIRWLNRINLDRVNLFVTANNLLTFTKYSGFDPEIVGERDQANPLTSKGVDRGRTPMTSLYSVGLNVKF